MENLYNVYIRAWSDYAEDRLMDVIENFMYNFLDDVAKEDWQNIKYFHENYDMHYGDYYGIEEEYAIENIETSEIVWKGDYPSEEIIRKISRKRK